jgi:hypothetical protein
MLRSGSAGLGFYQVGNLRSASTVLQFVRSRLPSRAKRSRGASAGSFRFSASLKRQQRTPEPLLKCVGVGGVGEAKSYEEIFALVSAASAASLNAVLAMEGRADTPAHSSGR